MGIPSREDYESFMNSFARGLERDHSDVCFYCYGSFGKSSFIPWVSDIDGGLILDSGVVTHKDKVLDIAYLFDESIGEREIKFDFNLLDLETNLDGRFLSYSQDYTDYIMPCARVVSGPNLLDRLNGLDYRLERLQDSAMTLRGLRNRVLRAYNDRRDFREFREEVKESIGKAIKFPKKLIFIKTGEVILDKVRAEASLRNLVQSEDWGENWQELYDRSRNPVQLYSDLSNSSIAIDLLVKSLGVVESMVGAYLKRFPKLDKIESRG